MSAFDATALLALHRPVVQYDSLESYYTDSAGVITDRPGNVLQLADGTVIAAAGPPSGGVPQLHLSFLRPDTYPSGHPVAPGDRVVEIGSDYVAQARQMHAQPGYANKAHGRIAVDSTGATWLQYWFFMYYDDPGFLDLGTHEGDIEMIQLKLDANGDPVAVTYAQHRSGVTANWNEVETEGASPVVYSARGTHASLLRAGDFVVSDRSLLPDHNDGKGQRVQLDLVQLSEGQTPWAFWPGTWGGTKPDSQVLGKVGVEANSPAALGHHPAWSGPAKFHASCDAADLPPIGQIHTAELAAPPQPTLQAKHIASRGVVRVKYDIPSPTSGPPARSLVIGVDSSNGQLPPATRAVPITKPTGVLEVAVPGDAKSAVVRATTHAADGGISETTPPVKAQIQRRSRKRTGKATGSTRS